MRLYFIPLTFVLLLSLSASTVQADWWDDIVEKVHEKLTQAANWLKDKAGPGIREKFNSAKKTLQDPETHEKVQDWVQQEALPVVKEKFEQFKSFINDDVMPEVQKMIEAGVEASKRRGPEATDERVKSED